MSQNPFFLEMLAKDRQQSFEQEARNIRMAKLSRDSKPLVDKKVFTRFANSLANMLIKAGNGLKNRYNQETCFNTDAYSSCDKNTCG